MADIEIGRQKKYKGARTTLNAAGSNDFIVGANARRVGIALSVFTGTAIFGIYSSNTQPLQVLWASSDKELSKLLTIEDFGIAIMEPLYGTDFSGTGVTVYFTEITLDF